MYRYRLISLLLLAACAAPQEPFNEEAALEKGRSMATATFQALSARLHEAMERGGGVSAVKYCSVAALPLVDSLAAVHGARIKRTSDRLRAPHDAPDAHERERLNAYVAELASGTKPAALEPSVFQLGDSVAYYQPILIVSPMCLKCHGTPGENIAPEVMEVLAERYPGDAAVGYVEGDFRGLWSARWPR